MVRKPQKTAENFGDPDRIRTCDRRIRNPMLYPAELAPRMPIREGAWQWEGRGGNNIFVHPSDLEKILKGIKELQG